MMYLGKMCLYGQGFPVDYDMALLWFEKAAEEVKYNEISPALKILNAVLFFSKG